MKLLNELGNLIVEEPMKWYDVALASTDMDDISGILKRNFSYKHNVMFHMLEKKGLGRKFLNRIVSYWDETDKDLRILQFLGGPKAYRNGSIDNDLFDEFIINPALEWMPTISVADDGKILYELMEGEEVNFFHDNVVHIAKIIFTDEYDDEMFRWDTHESMEDLINLLSQENYIKLVRYVTINWQNEVVHSFREEFETWVDEDGVGDNGFFITPSRMNHYITDDDRYNFLVLLDSTDEFEGLVSQIENEYNTSWSMEVESQYYNEYHKALGEYMGGVVKEGTTWTYTKDGKKSTPTKFYDVTNTIRDILFKWVEHNGEIDENELYHLIVNGPDLEPDVMDYPDDDEAVIDNFNKNFDEALY
jgi:hypothetical protein